MVDGDSNLIDGRVLRLHFSCQAELPYGSCLRVTSSNAMCASTLSRESTDGDEGDRNNQNSIYASSVEMVTSPEEYPVWRTRTPVISVVNNASSEGIFTHRYRYLVVTPGAGTYSLDHSATITTSDDKDGYTSLDAVWEDPFWDQTVDEDRKLVRERV